MVYMKIIFACVVWDNYDLTVTALTQDGDTQCRHNQ
jgi:hypothetical protein